MARIMFLDADRIKPHRLIIALFFSSMLLIFSAIVDIRATILDTLAAIFFLGIILIYDSKAGLSDGAFMMLCIASLLNPMGVYGAYSEFILAGIVGYDKIIHVFCSLAVAYALLEYGSERYTGRKSNLSLMKVSVIVLIVGGLGVLVEISEFIGTRYFGLDHGGIFASGDTLPQMRSDLQRYDVYFDMAFNMIGAIIAGLAALLNEKTLPSRISGDRKFRTKDFV